jgi:LysR family transcriptional regulator, regulator of gene expression of beta-lactamase
MRRLPSLNGLRAFEAAGRHCSFTNAAKELSVTQTAVSRSVRILEERLGFPLFVRQASTLQLTARGRALLAGLTDAFDCIAKLTDDVAAMRPGPVLTVGVGPTLATNWLIPRLVGFHASHPDIEVRVVTGGATRPIHDDWTCTVRRDVRIQPGYTADHLFQSMTVPVCRPEIASSLRSPGDLSNVTLIQVSSMSDDWPHWFKVAGLRGRPTGGIAFESNALAIQAVFDGVGVAIAQLPYVSAALTSGRLVAPFSIFAPTPESWRLQYRKVRKDDPALNTFRKWLLQEAKHEYDVQAMLIRRAKGLGPAKARLKGRPQRRVIEKF